MVERFIRDGFIRLDGAFSTELAEQGRAILWGDTGCDPQDPSTWVHPVVRLGDYGQQPFCRAANTLVLHSAFDELVGRGRWLPRLSLGTFPVRFPSPGDPGDTGWHVDASFPGDDDSLFSWRVNVTSRGRALLMLFLFSDVTDHDAPTRIRIGSHLDVARILRAFRRTGNVVPGVGRNIGRHRGPGRGACDRKGGDGLSLSPISGSRRSTAPRPESAFFGPAASISGGAAANPKG